MVQYGYLLCVYLGRIVSEIVDDYGGDGAELARYPADAHEVIGVGRGEDRRRVGGIDPCARGRAGAMASAGSAVRVVGGRGGDGEDGRGRERQEQRRERMAQKPVESARKRTGRHVLRASLGELVF